MEIRGLDKDKVSQISNYKKEAEWIRQYRLESFDKFLSLKMPSFGPKYEIDFEKIIYYKSSENKLKKDWQDIDDEVREELKDLGVMESERHLDGIGVQYESEVIYHNMVKELEDKKIIFTSMEEAMAKHPEIAKKYFGKIVKNDENKFAALNGAVFSGGSFIYIPPKTKLDRPLQSYFRINARNMGQFERTLIIVDDDSELHYVEGCTAPSYSDSSLHAAVVEIYVGKNSKCRYTTIQNWADNVLNLVTKRALVEESGVMEWVDGNIGSKVTMKYPSCILKGDNSSGSTISISVAKERQEQDTGSNMIHVGKNTKSSIISKTIASSGGIANYRGKVEIKESAENAEANIQCDSLIMDSKSKSDAYPNNIVANNSSNLEHEATVSKISEEKLFYMESRGIPKEKAIELIVLGFIEKFREELPMEYAVELNYLLKSNL